MKYSHINEIQALRGISIILVFLFHLNQEIFSYGYLGVDIFFVISGFIITKIINQNLLINKFSLKFFYTSRFLRLVPSLLVMVFLVSLFILATYQIHSDPNILINTGLSSLVGLSNFYLIFIENDYFNSFDENIFEHMWSLSVEFQFYLIYPLFLIILSRVLKNKNNFYTHVYLLILIIYILSNVFFRFEYFYHTGSRIGELVIGCLTYFIYQKKSGKSFYILLITLIFILIYFINQNIFYLIMSVCFFTSYIILNMTRIIFLKKVLGNKFLLIFGDASYSLYLWHLPVIFFTNIFFNGLDYYFLSISISFILSYLSFEFVEKPFRRSLKIKKFTLIKIFTLKKISTVCLTIVVLFIYIDQTNSRNKLLQKQQILYKNISNKIGLFNIPKISNTKNHTCHENYKKINFKPKCFKRENNNNLIYFFGDSSMLDFFYSFENLDIDMDKLFSSYNNSSFWKPTLNSYSKGSDEVTGRLSQNLDLLEKNYDQIFLILSFNHKFNYDVVNKSAQYYNQQENTYIEMIKILPKNVKLIFIKDTPQFKYSAQNCFIIQQTNFKLLDNTKNNIKCDHYRDSVLKKMTHVNKMFYNLKKNYDLKIINLDKYFCENEKCSFYKDINSEKFAKKYDGHHYSVKTSEDISYIFNKKLKNVLINKDL